MINLNQVIVYVAKEISPRVHYWGYTILEIIMPVIVMIFMNLSVFPNSNPLHEGYFMETDISISCNRGVTNTRMTVIYEPRNNFTDALMAQVKCVEGFDVKAGEIQQDEFTFDKMGVMFKGTDSKNSVIPDSLDYEVFSPTNKWLGTRDLWREDTKYTQSYSDGKFNNFLKLIRAIDESFLQLKKIPTPQINLSSMDIVDTSPTVYKVLILVSFFIGFSFMISPAVGSMMAEKCSGAKELVVMMGMKKWHIWTAKLYDCIWLSGLSMLLMLFFLYFPLTEHSHVLTVLPFSVLGTYLYLALFGVLVFLFFMSCFFDDCRLARLAMQVLWFASFSIFLFMSMFCTEVSFSFWLLCCLVPHFSLFTGLSILLDFDYYGKEFNTGEILSVDPNYPTYCDITLILIFQIVFYLALGLYLEEVNPGEFGIPKPYNFFLKKSYWDRSKVKYENMNSAPEDKVQNVDFESVADGMKVEISIRNLRKEFKILPGRRVVTVDDVSIDFYSGEITVLLGHNGAGKTALFSALSGLTQTASGRILINGYDIVENTDEARRSLGYCHQQDILFENLTPFENLRFFAMAKGLGVWDASEEAHKFLDKLKLYDEERTLVHELSRELRRKICLGIALIAGTEVVLLDGLTSGLDPEAKREIWEILLSFKGTRTILLTTNSAEEADVLSDRIAIMDHGKIKYYGTPMYLKSKYGSGYSLSVELKNPEEGQGLTEFIQKFVKTAKLTRQSMFTLTYQLPEEEKAHFPMLFAGLDNMQNSGEIQSYSKNFPSIEDVFLRLRQKESEEDRIDMADHSSYKRFSCFDKVYPMKIYSLLLPFHQFYALVVKKYTSFTRNIRSYLMFSVIAALFVITSFVITPALVKDPPENEAGQPGNLTYSLELYGKYTVPYSIASENELPKYFAEYFAKHGWETRRVENVEKELQKIYRDNFYAYMRETLLAVKFTEYGVKIFPNAYAVHMVPLAVNAFYNSILLANNVSGEIKTSVNQMYSGKVKEHTFFTRDLENKLPSPCSISDIPDFIGIQALFYLIEPMRERLSGAKDLHLMTTSGTLYWLSHLIFDSATFAIYLLVPTLTIRFSTEDDMFLQNKEEIYFGMVLWGIGLILLAYVLSSVTNSLILASAAFLAVYLAGTYWVKPEMWTEVLQYYHPSSILKIGLSSTCAKEGNHYWTALIIYSIALFAFLVLKDNHVRRNLLYRPCGHILRGRYEQPARKDANVNVQGELVKELTNSGDNCRDFLIIEGMSSESDFKRD